MSTSIRGLFAASLLAGSALAATPAFADETEAPKEFTVTGNVALTTDYRFRGVSQSGGDFAIQGGITVSHSSGFYISTWSSSISEDSLPGYGSQELDVFGGWTGEVSPGLTLDAGLLYYIYPSGTSAFKTDFFEPYASISGQAGPAKLKLGAAYGWKQDSLVDINGDSHDNLYVYGNVDVAVPNTPLTVSGHVGYTDGVLAPCYYCNGDKSGWDWSVGASATIYGPLSASVSYVGDSNTSVDGFTDDTVVGTLTASF